jgi:protein-tyrosine-phosphatase/predicted ATP-grasp superfamily ATP-dependent carboligase
MTDSLSRKILVLDAECNAATCVVQSLGREGHIVHLGGLSEGPFSFRSRYVVRSFHYPSPLESRTAFLAWFIAHLGRESYDYILPLSDITLYPLRSLSPRPLSLVLPPEESFEWFFDKAKTLELARWCGVPTPSTRLLPSREDFDVRDFSDFPYFVKLTRSKIWVGDLGHDLEARLARTPHDLSEAVSKLNRYGPVLVQSYESGDGVGIELLCDRGRVLLSFAHQRIHEYPLTGGGSTYRVSIPIPPALFSASERLVREANWTGVAMVEFKKAGEGFSLMEVNGRFWGSLPLSYRSGVDFPCALIDLLEGRTVHHLSAYRTGVRSRRFSTDLSWFKRNLVADRSDPYTKTRPLARTLLEYGGFLTGRDHWDHAAWSDPGPILAEMRVSLGKNIADLLSRGLGLLAKKTGPARSRFRLAKILKNPELRTRPARVLVVCYGNICRSPLVERLLRQSLDPGRVEARSCGFIKREGRTSPEDYLLIALEAGVDLSAHRSSAISPDAVSWADVILLMDRQNWKMMRDYSQESAEKVLWLGGWAQERAGEIPDPYGKDPEEMGRLVGIMAEATEAFARDLALFLPGLRNASLPPGPGEASLRSPLSPGGC